MREAFWNAARWYDENATPLGTPMALTYALLPVGFGVLGLTFVARLWQPIVAKASERRSAAAALTISVRRTPSEVIRIGLSRRRETRMVVVESGPSRLSLYRGGRLTMLKNRVLVVGAAPTGLALAIELARRGVPFHMVDRRPEPLGRDRAIVVKSRSLELLADMGLADTFLRRGRAIRGIELFSDGTKVASIGSTVSTVRSLRPLHSRGRDRAHRHRRDGAPWWPGRPWA
jgi:hypothetical protein